MRNALPKSGELIEQLQAIGILNARGNEIFYGRIVVPIFDSAGNVAGFYGRRLSDEEPKHIYLRGERRGVFNSVAAKASQSLLLVESIFDAMSLWAAGLRNVISLYGKDGWTSDHEALVRQNGVTEIVLALDSDARGQEAADALATKLASLVQAVHRITWPEGVKDANDFFLSRSVEEFKALLPQPSAAASNDATAGEKITLTADGFTIAIDGRAYELCAIEKPSASRLKATIKALSDEPAGARFHIDTVDFYLSRSRKSFVAEAARLFREMPDAIEADMNRLIVAAEKYVAQKLDSANAAVVTIPDAERLEAIRMGRSAGLVDELQRDLAKLGIIGEEGNRLLLYLGLTSRKMDDPLAIQILSSSGAGKSHLRDPAHVVPGIASVARTSARDPARPLAIAPTFYLWLTNAGIDDLREVNCDHIRSYQLALTQRGLTTYTLHAKLIGLRRFFEHLESLDAILVNPCAGLMLPKLEDRLPRGVLSQAEARRVLEAPDTQSKKGIRDRGILELFYSTGIRGEEMAALTIHDVDCKSGFVRVHKGKFAKDRVVPMGAKASAYVREYLAQVRLAWSAQRKDERALWLSATEPHRALKKQAIAVMVNE